MAQKIVRHELVVIPIPNGTTQNKFLIPDQPNLRGALIDGIEIYCVDQLAKEPTQQLALLSASDVQKNSFITLVDDNNDEFVKLSPALLWSTLSIDGAAATNIRENNSKQLAGRPVNWPKSYITFNATPTTGADKVYVLSVMWRDPKKDKAGAKVSCPHR